MKLKKGDNIIVTAGKHKGAKGKIAKVFSAEQRVLVEGVNKIKKHMKPKSRNEKGSTIEIEAPLHISNVMFVDSKTGKGTRIGKKTVDGKMVRFTKASDTVIK